MAHITFATCDTVEDRDLHTSDAALAAYLEKHYNCTVVAVPWTEITDTWATDVVFLRATWDYPQRQEEFRSWINNSPHTLINPPHVLLWNMDKSYLLDLQSLGVLVAPTRIIPHSAPETLHSALADLHAPSVVIKPCISGGGWKTACFHIADDDAAVAAAAAAVQDISDRGIDVIVQEYMPEIQDQGELGLVFFDGEYQYALSRTPPTGELIVAFEQTCLIQDGPPDSVISDARHYLHTAAKHLQNGDEDGPFPFAYARVDVIVRESDVGSTPLVYLMEMELIEPYLWLDLVEDHQVGGLAETLVARLPPAEEEM